MKQTKQSRRVIPLACRICKKVFDFSMGYNWQACDNCTKEALRVAELEAHYIEMMSPEFR